MPMASKPGAPRAGMKDFTHPHDYCPSVRARELGPKTAERLTGDAQRPLRDLEAAERGRGN